MFSLYFVVVLPYEIFKVKRKLRMSDNNDKTENKEKLISKIARFFENAKGFWPTPTEQFEERLKLSRTTILLQDYFFKVLHGNQKDYDLFKVAELAEKVKCSQNSIRSALKEGNDAGSFLVYDMGNKGKVILINKPSNVELLKKIIAGETFFNFSRYLKVEGLPFKVLGVDTQDLKCNTSEVAGQHRCSIIIDNESEQLPIDHLFLDNDFIDHQSSDQLLNDDEKNNLSNLTTELPEVENNQNLPGDSVGQDLNRVPPGPAQDGDQGEYKKLCLEKLKTEGVKEPKLSEIINNPVQLGQVEIRIKSKNYLDLNKIKNWTGYLIKSIESPENYPLPEALVNEKFREKDLEEKSRWSKFCSNLGFSVALPWADIKLKIGECKNLYKTDEQLFDEKFDTYLQNYLQFKDHYDYQTAYNLATEKTEKYVQGIKKTLRTRLTKILDYLKYHSEPNKHNINTIIKDILKRLEVQKCEVFA